MINKDTITISVSHEMMRELEHQAYKYDISVEMIVFNAICNDLIELMSKENYE